MTLDETFIEITGKNKWYNQVGIKEYCSQQSASALIKRHKLGKVRFEKYVHLFTHYGYYQTEMQWNKR